MHPSSESHLLSTGRQGRAMGFVLFVGLLSFFTNMAHEGSRS